jgi:C_GCAxxG_C_C family probable redox protein
MGLGTVCGAVTGATMVLGFKFQGKRNERKARYKTYELVREFVKRFEARHGTVMCKGLLKGIDLSNEEGRKKADKQKLFTTVCPGYVKDAAQILDEML